MSGQQFREAGYALVDRTAELLDSVRERRVKPAESVATVRAALDSGRPLPQTGTDVQELMERSVELLFEHSLFNGHPRFFGYITSSPAPIGMLGDFLAAAVNANVGGWNLAPMATEIEAQTIRWIAEFLGYPQTCGGLFVSGGNMANITCFLAARAAQTRWDVRQAGVAGGPRLCVYATRETHTWLQKAADITGLGTDAIHWLDGPTLSIQQLRDRYEEDVREGFLPFLVIGTAGTVSTGEIDPLADIAAFCKDHALWFHVDGAYGAFAAAVPALAPRFAGLELADSIAVDPHRWLYAPLEAGCALVRNPLALRDAFSYHPPYYSFGVEALNYFDWGPQNSRGFRALKVWLALQQAGAAEYRRRITEDMALSAYLYELASQHPELQALSHSLSITTLRYVPAGWSGSAEDLNGLNQRLQRELEESGQVFCSNAVIDGTYALRFCIVNFRTSRADIEAIPPLLVQLGRRLYGEMRS